MCILLYSQFSKAAGSNPRSRRLLCFHGAEFLRRPAATKEKKSMNFIQVNQRSTFEREFRSGYLCCPEGTFAGWQYMTALQIGDIIFHYNSPQQAVLAISLVSRIGQHKGTAMGFFSPCRNDRRR